MAWLPRSLPLHAAFAAAGGSIFFLPERCSVSVLRESRGGGGGGPAIHVGGGGGGGGSGECITLALSLPLLLARIPLSMGGRGGVSPAARLLLLPPPCMKRAEGVSLLLL